MDDIAFSAGPRSRPHNPASENAAISAVQTPAARKTAEHALTGDGPPAEAIRAVAEPVHFEAQSSRYQARLSYDRDKASVFVEILDTAGEVIQRFPAEDGVDRLNQLTGRSAGAIADLLA